MALPMRKLLVLAILALFVNAIFGDTAAEEDSTTSRNLTELPYYVITAEGRIVLKQEFKDIPDGQRRPWTIAELPENIEKNRYKDLLAYDDTRVVLNPLSGDPYSDYINANYIDGYKKEKEYVATQGPLPSTINDFWRMIWELNATKIVMLADLVENGSVKVAKYWPDIRATYGDITVHMISENSMEEVNHVIRTFNISKPGLILHRTIRQFHFTGWPDLGVPDSTLPVVALMRQARKYKPCDKAPIVVHCSAGVGRTGTTILLDSMIQQAVYEAKVDFPKKLNQMRLQRAFVVEKKEQYVFAHKAVFDIFFSREWEDRLKKVENKYDEINKHESGDTYQPPSTLHYNDTKNC